MTVAEVDDKVRLRAIQTWMDPLEMFRQIAPKGVVNKATMNRNVEKEVALDEDTANDGKAVAADLIRLQRAPSASAAFCGS